MPTPFSDLKKQLIPDDETGAVLRAMLDDGDDLDRPREIAFLSVFAEQRAAEAFGADASALPDVRVEAPEPDEEGIWQVAVVRTMAASHAAITALEDELAAIAARHGGYPDGWSCDAADASD